MKIKKSRNIFKKIGGNNVYLKDTREELLKTSVVNILILNFSLTHNMQET